MKKPNDKGMQDMMDRFDISPRGDDFLEGDVLVPDCKTRTNSPGHNSDVQLQGFEPPRPFPIPVDERESPFIKDGPGDGGMLGVRRTSGPIKRH